MKAPKLLALSLIVSASLPAFSATCQTGQAALTDWTGDAPGVCRHIQNSDIPAPPQGTDPEKSVAKPITVVPVPANALPKVPEGFSVEVFASGLKQPRIMRFAPNGDLFLSEVGSGRVLVYPGGKPTATPAVFTEGLDRPYGIAFYPAQNPKYVYIAASDQVVRYPYKKGDTKASAAAQVIVPNIPNKRHWTRDLAISADGKRLLVSVGSATNVAGGMPDKTAAEIAAHEKVHGRGAAWGEELDRAVVRSFDPEGKSVRNYATGLRNCSGLATDPKTKSLYCVVIERDHVGPDLVPDMFVSVREGDFHGWPWYYLNGLEDPAWTGKRPELKQYIRAPEVMIMSHSSPISASFYSGKAFPAEYQGNAFIALHGSHSKPNRAGYKVVRAVMKNGKATGEYIDFMTGFMVDNDHTWGRPTGVVGTPDGALLVSEDGNGVVYRVKHK